MNYLGQSRTLGAIQNATDAAKIILIINSEVHTKHVHEIWAIIMVTSKIIIIKHNRQCRNYVQKRYLQFQCYDNYSDKPIIIEEDNYYDHVLKLKRGIIIHPLFNEFILLGVLGEPWVRMRLWLFFLCTLINKVTQCWQYTIAHSGSVMKAITYWVSMYQLHHLLHSVWNGQIG